MKNKIFLGLGLLGILLFNGCSSLTLHNINKIDSQNKYKKALSDVVFLSYNGDSKIRYEIYQDSNQCQKDFTNFVKLIGKQNTLHKELLAREINLHYLNKNDKPKRLLALTPGPFYGCEQGSLFPIGQTVEINLFDIESISYNWDKIDIDKKMNSLKWLSNNLKIYRKEYFIFANDYEQNIVNLSSDIVMDLESLGILPSKRKTLEQVEKELALKRKSNTIVK